MKSRGGNGDFKSPGSSGTPDSPGGNPKKKRRTSTAAAASNSSATPAGQQSQMNEHLPPQPMSGYYKNLNYDSLFFVIVMDIVSLKMNVLKLCTILAHECVEFCEIHDNIRTDK